MISRLHALLGMVPGLKPDISFQRDDAYRFLPRMIALVMAMVACMLLLAISLSTSLTQTANTQRDTLLVHVPAQEKQADITSAIMQSLKNSPDVKSSELLTASELTKQIQPWLGGIEHIEELPVPNLIRLHLAQEYSDATLTKIKDQLSAVDTSIIIDAPAEWSANYARFSRIIQWVLFGFSAALLLGVLGLMSFVATTAMKLHRRTVILLHSIGATDNYIAAQFQANSALLAIKGALMGTIAAAIIYIALGAYVDSLNAAMLPDLGLKWVHAYVILLLPIIAAIVGFASGRLASLHYLKRLM